MSLQKPSIVIFDMDGTSVRHLNPAILHVLEKLDDGAYRVKKFFDRLLRRDKKALFVSAAEDAYHARKKPRLPVHRAIHKFRRKPVEQIVEPCPGIYQVLELLKAHNIPAAVVSNGLGKGYGHEIMETFGFEDYFQASIFREDIHNSKPHPEPILLALREILGGKETQEDDVIWYIGDRHKDITASIEANKLVTGTVQPIAYGVNAAAAVIEKGVGPDHIIMSYFDMHTRLSRFFRAENVSAQGGAKPHAAKTQAAEIGDKIEGIARDVKTMIRNISGSSGGGNGTKK
ncbi:MAG: HAD family hydrolase [Micavibrio sp.]|nr:HAD family hydrolase [Micavibrio sp.]